MSQLNDSKPAQAASNPQIDSLHQTATSKPEAQDKTTGEDVQELHSNIMEGLHELFAKHGVKTFELCYTCPKTNRDMLMAGGNLVPVTKLAVKAFRELQARYYEEIGMKSPEQDSMAG